jgi:hypothetical protein
VAKTLKNLALALLNATLILVALCLFLLWKVVDTADGLLATFAQNLEIVAPLRDEAQQIKAEVVGLRSDLAMLKQGADGVGSVALDRINVRLEAMDARLQNVGASMTDLADAPQELIDHAIVTSADAFATSLSRARGCVPVSG